MKPTKNEYSNRTRNEYSKTRRSWRYVVAALALTATLFLPACGGDKNGKEAHGAGQKKGGAPDGNGGAPPLQTMTVAVEPAARGDISTYYRATASLDPEKQAEILARVQGPVKRILAEEGDDVREGQVLLVVDDSEYRHRLTQAKVALDQAKAKFTRIEQIISQGLVSVESFDTAKSELDAAKAGYEAAALELSWCEIRAPFSGRIVRRTIDQGQNISSGAQLFSLADMHTLLARVHVPAREFRQIQTDQPVRLTVDSTRDELTGSIILISPIVDPRTGTIKVTVEITKYPASTRPGNFAEVSIVTARHIDALVVPNLAVLTDKDQRVVYVADGEVAKRKVVKVGFEDDQFIEILAGLDEKAPVVIQGQRSLSDGQPIKIIDQMELGKTKGETEAEKLARTKGAG